MRAMLKDRILDDHFRTFGFVVVPFLTEQDVALLTSIYEDLGPAPDDPRLSIYLDYQSTSSAYKRSVVEAVRPTMEARGAEFLVDLHLFYPEFIMKWPGHRSGFAPHIDVTFVDEDRFSTLSTWCPLTDVTGRDHLDNGMVWLVPGSHGFARWPQAFEPDFTYGGIERSVIEEFGVGVPVRAGEALVFDHRIVHFSLPNSSESPRLAIDGNWRPQEAELLHYRQAGPQDFDLYLIDDTFFYNTDPVSLKAGPPPGAPFVRTLTVPRPRFSAEEFAAACRTVPPVTYCDVRHHALEWMHPDAGDGWYVMVNDDWRLRSVPFCARCGTEDDLQAVNRSEQGVVVHLCARCGSGRPAREAFAEMGWTSAAECSF